MYEDYWKILVDKREPNSRVLDLYKYFNDKRNFKKNVMIETKQLETGDIIINDKYCFEFKTYDDYIASIQDSRLYNQIRNMCTNFTGNSYVIVQVDDLIEEYDNSGYFTYKQLYGSVARFSTALPVIFCRTLNDCFSVMRKIVEYSEEVDFPYKTLKSGNICFNILAYCIKGVGRDKANKIVQGLKLECINDLLDLTIDDLIKIDGIGEKTAEKIIENISKERCD